MKSLLKNNLIVRLRFKTRGAVRTFFFSPKDAGAESKEADVESCLLAMGYERVEYYFLKEEEYLRSDEGSTLVYYEILPYRGVNLLFQNNN